MRNILFGAACLVACTEAARPTSTAPPIASDASPVPAKPAKWEGPLPAFSAWTEAPAIDALVRGAPLPDATTDPRGCGFDVPEQSCIPGPEAFTWACRSDCAKDCDTCSTDCRAAMTSPCDRACGAKAGACVQACLAKRDHCATGDCVSQLAAIQKEIASKYGCKDKGTPLDICKRLIACTAPCDGPKIADDKRDACRAACTKSRAAGCSAHFLEIVSNGFGTCTAFEPSGI